MAWAVGLFKTPHIYQDFLGQWKLCAYALRGIDPYPLIGVETPAVKELGIIPAYWGTTPYGLLLGNLFYAGFLAMATATLIPSTPDSINKDLTAYREINSALEPAEICFVSDGDNYFSDVQKFFAEVCLDFGVAFNIFIRNVDTAD